MQFDYWQCFRESRMRNELRKIGYEFTPFEKIFLAYNSLFTFSEKANAFEEIIKCNGDIVISAGNAPGCSEVYGSNLGLMLRKYLNDRKKILGRFRSLEPRSFYKACFKNNNLWQSYKEHSDGYIPGCFESFDECMEKANAYKHLMTDVYYDFYTLYIEKHYYDTKESPFDDAIIYCSYNKGKDLLTVEEVCTGIVTYPDPDIELLKQLDFDFLTPLKIRYRNEDAFI